MFDEFEPMMPFTEEQIEAYFARIGFTGTPEPTKAVLDELIWLHQLAIPFETLDCHDFRIGVDIHPDVVFDKIVRRHRGGHCLELNGAFYRLLLSLGFNVRPCLTRVLLGSDEFTHPIDHRTTLVSIDGHTYFCDVGLGGPMPSAALDIDKTDWMEMHGEDYCVQPSEYEGWFYICRKTPKGNHNAGTADAMRIELMFSLIRCFETDYVFLNHYMSFVPSALHCSHRILNLRTETGYRLINDDIYREINCGEVIGEYSVTGRLQQILQDKFGIYVDI